MTEVKESSFKLGGLKVHVRTLLVLTVCTLLVLVYVTFGSMGPANQIQGQRHTAKLIPPISISSNIADIPVVSDEKQNPVELVKKVRILCLILTMEKDLQTKVNAVNRTWAIRCDKHLYVIYSKQRKHDFLNIDIPDNRNNLIYKMQEVYKQVYKLYLNDFDFLLKADDDTYVIVENLKFLLFHYDPNEPGYLGFHFNKFVKSGYMSGGAGYVISNRGLRHLIERGYEKGVCEIKKRKDDPENSEDLETGMCLEAAGVKVWSSLDSEGSETFHPYPLERHLLGNLPGYIYSWAKNPVKSGKKCCSRYTISYHYVQPEAMFFLHHVLYETSVFGLYQDLYSKEPVFIARNVT